MTDPFENEQLAVIEKPLVEKRKTVYMVVNNCWETESKEELLQYINNSEGNYIIIKNPNIIKPKLTI